jgi:3-demethylubiquinone-9 3-methyltransferase
MRKPRQRNSRVGSSARYGEEGAKTTGRPTCSVMTVAFELDGQDFTALNGGPHSKFTEAISLVVNCETQDEVDHVWEKLSAGGQEGQSGYVQRGQGACQQRHTILAGQRDSEETRGAGRRRSTRPHARVPTPVVSSLSVNGV